MQRLQTKISSVFYYHGLVCASHPIPIISFVISVVLITCLPLTNLSTFNNAHIEYQTLYKSDNNITLNSPKWLHGVPFAYVAQFVFKTTVWPWKANNHVPSDAFRASLHQAFDILDTIRNFQVITKNGTNMVLSNYCLHAFQTINALKDLEVLPESGCLIISPTNFWKNNRMKFMEDPVLIKTLFKNYGNILESKPDIREHLFGLINQERGISRLYFRNRQRIISFTFTLFLKTFHRDYLEQLNLHLQNIYPFNTGLNDTENNIVHQHYKNKNVLINYTPLILPYVVLFLYLYFSVKKIEMVKSKWGLAFSAVCTVFSSLLMSAGICTFFGVSPTLSGSEILPYLVVIIGIENTIVVTKSVVSTPFDIQVKFRVAKGLQKEGWSIFKNLLIELTILAFGFATFVQAIQEFCLFAVVGLLTDFFLQMMFYATVLSVDMRRLELSDLTKYQHELTAVNELDIEQLPVYQCPIKSMFTAKVSSPISPKNKVSYSFLKSSSKVIDSKFQYLPRQAKRIRLMDFIARNRFIQRALMFCFILWLILFFYKSGIVEHLQSMAKKNTKSFMSPEEILRQQMKHTNVEQWRMLSKNHFPAFFAYYNISLDGRYISILPSRHFSIVISPQDAINLRHPKEGIVEENNFFSNFNGDEDEILRLYPTSTKELIVTLMFVLLSAILVIYLCAGIGRFMCSRRYEKSQRRSQKYKHTKLFCFNYAKSKLMVSNEIALIDLVAVDGTYVLVSFLTGRLALFDSLTGKCIHEVDRNSLIKTNKSIDILSSKRKLNERENKFVFNFSDNMNSDKISLSSKPYDFLAYNLHKENKHSNFVINSNVWCIDLYESKAGVGCENGSLEIWNLIDSTLIFHDFSLTVPINFILIRSNILIVTRIDGSVGVYINNILSQTVSVHRLEITSQYISSNKFLTGSKDECVKLSEIYKNQLKIVRTLYGHSAPITKVTFDDIGAVSICEQGDIRFWDLQTGTCTRWMKENLINVTTLTVHDSAVVVLAPGTYEKLWLVDRDTGKLNNFTITKDIYSALLLEQKIIAVGCYASLEFWDPISLSVKFIVRFEKSLGRVTNILKLSNGSIVCSVGSHLQVVDLPVYKTD